MSEQKNSTQIRAAAPLISVVMPVYNGAAFLKEALHSILTQTFRDFELLAVDDGSTDDSLPLLHEAAAEDSRIKVISQLRSGSCQARNAGCNAARGTWIAMMDADDIAVPDRLERQLKFVTENPDVGLLGGSAICFSASSPLRHTVTFPRDDAAIRTALRRGNCFYHCTMLFKRALLERAGYYRPIFEGCEDYDLWLRMMPHTHAANMSKVLVYYRQHPGQVSYAQVERMVYGACALKAINRNGKEPPLPATITESFLLELGLSVNEIEDALQDAHWGKAEFLGRCGFMELSEKILRAGESLVRRTFPCSRSQARHYRARMLLALWQHSFFKSLVDFIRYSYFRVRAFLSASFNQGA